MSFAVAAVAAGATIVGSIIQGNAAENAAETQAGATREGIGEQRRQFDLTREDYAPYREAGRRGLEAFESELNRPVTSADVMQDPGYQFGLQQGQTALDRRIAAMGGRVSGSSLKAAARYGTDYATTGYNAAYQRRQDRLNRLAALAGIGQSATGSSAAAGQNMANNVSGMLTAQGDASAAAQLARGNIWGNTANQIAALYGRTQKTTQPVNNWSGWGGTTDDPWYG